MLLAAYFIINALIGQIAVPGYASTIVAVLLLGGAQLVSLGIIGEYVGRMHLNVNRKPRHFLSTCPPHQIQYFVLVAGRSPPDLDH